MSDDYDWGRDAQIAEDERRDYEIAVAQIMSDNERDDEQRRSDAT